MAEIIKIGSRSYRLNQKSEAQVSPVHQVSINGDNKVFAKSIVRYCKSQHIFYSLDKNSLRIQTEEPKMFSQVISFKERTFNHPYTHFVSIPLIGLDISEFKADAWRMCESPNALKGCGHKEAFFMDDRKLHLTVAMLTILDAPDMDRARAALAQIQFAPLSIRLSGLAVMKGTPSMCNVLYVGVKESVELDALGESIRRVVLDAGVSDSVDTKWHCTLMNSKYFDQQNGCKGSWFDARQILQKASHDFGELTVAEFHLSCLSSPPAPDGYYAAELIKKAV